MLCRAEGEKPNNKTEAPGGVPALRIPSGPRDGGPDSGEKGHEEYDKQYPLDADIGQIRELEGLRRKGEEGICGGEVLEDLKGSETWRIFRIMSEFIEGFDELSDIGPAVSIFGSARFKEEDEYYKKTIEVAELLAQNGYSVITGGGPGVMEAANWGAGKSKV